jgi:hypothetical protein
MGTVFKSFSPDLKYVFQKTDEIRLYFYKHSHRAERSVLGNLLLYLVHNNVTVPAFDRRVERKHSQVTVYIQFRW